MTEFSKGERVGSPLNFDWGDGLIDPKGKMDVSDLLMGNNEGSIAGDEPLDFNDLSKSGLKDAMGELSKPKSVNTDSRKRSLSSNTSQISDSSGTISRRKKKPKGMPKRPLSAYNLYFKTERAKIQEAAQGAGEKIGFEGLGKIIGKKWQELSLEGREVYEKLAEKDTLRYRKEMEAYNDLKAKRVEEEERLASSKPIPEARENNQQASQVQVRPAEAETYERNPERAAQQDSFVLNQQPQSMHISSREQFSRLHSMTVPMSSSPYAHDRGTPQFGGDRAPTGSMQPSYQLQYEETQSVPTPQGSHHVSMPPPPKGAERVRPPESFHMPPGMEIVLSDRSGRDRKYRVQYSCYSMSRDAARKYIEGLTGPSSQEQQLMSPPLPVQQQQPQQPQQVPMVGLPMPVPRGPPQGHPFQTTVGWSNF